MVTVFQRRLQLPEGLAQVFLRFAFRSIGPQRSGQGFARMRAVAMNKKITEKLEGFGCKIGSKLPVLLDGSLAKQSNAKCIH